VIKINLLPPELQRAASLPKLVFYTLTASVTAVMLVGIASLWVWIDKGNLETAVQDRETEVSRLEAQAEQLDRINKDIDYYRERESAIIQIKTRRILWGKKLDQLARLTPEDIWIDRLLMETLDPGEYRWEAGKEQRRQAGPDLLDREPRPGQLHRAPLAPLRRLPPLFGAARHERAPRSLLRGLPRVLAAPVVEARRLG